MTVVEDCDGALRHHAEPEPAVAGVDVTGALMEEFEPLSVASSWHLQVKMERGQ